MSLGPKSKKQELMLKHDAQILVIGGSAGGAKVQPYSSDIYTPWGIKKMGDLKKGDIISAPDGSPQRVLNIYEQGIIDVYECEFDDGSKCEVGDEHLWLIHKTKSQKTKKTGNFSINIFPNGRIMNTAEIIKWLAEKDSADDNKYIKKQNLIIPLCDPIGFNINKYKRKIPPYILGALLGDGCMSDIKMNVTLTTIDKEIIRRFEKEGYKLNKRKSISFGISKKTGISDDLNFYGLLGTKSINKFIPVEYKYSPIKDRFNLIHGLMDTDGYIDSRGHMSYTTISKKLAIDFQWVVQSLGCKAKITKKESGYKDQDGNYIKCNDSYTVCFKPAYNPKRFINIERKKERCKDFNGGLSPVGRRFKNIKFVRKERGRCIAVSHPSRLYITNDFIVTHNTYTLNMIPLRYIDCPHFNGIMFRRTTVQLKGQGGMWDTANDIFSQLGKNKPKTRDYDLTATWKNGCKIKYSHMEHVKNKLDHQGLQYTFIGFDEGTHFEWEQVEYLMSRLRSKSKYPSRMVISCNPDPDSWLYEMVEWYLDEAGFPDPEKDGVVRYFIRRDGMFIWSNDKQELIDKYSTKHKKAKPLSFSFISSTIYDNPVCMQDNPEYVDFLEGLNPIEKARLLHGNWKIRPEGANYFKRDWLNKASRVPKDAICCRAWDKASTEPHDKNKYPDYTACIKMYKTASNEFYIAGEFDPDNHDNTNESVYGKFRHKPGKRDNLIFKQSKYDGKDCKIVLPKDAGSAGETEYIESAKKLAIHGFIVKKDLATNAASKLQKYMPVSAAMENGFVYIVESTFPNKETLEAFYKENEAFDGEKSGKLKKDDWPDCLASAYNYLTKEVVIPNFTLPSCSTNTKLIKMKKAVA